MRSKSKRVLMDSSALIAWIKDEPGAQRLAGLFGMIDRGDAHLVASVIVLGEVFKRSTAQVEAVRQREDQKLATIRSQLESPDVVLLDVTPPIVRKAAEYRASHKLSLPDAIHLSTAMLNRCDWFITLDTDFPKLEGLRVYRAELLDSNKGLPWDVHVQEPLFNERDNVTPIAGRTQLQR